MATKTIERFQPAAPEDRRTVTLAANSYDLAALDAATNKALTSGKEEGREGRAQAAVRKQALLGEVLDAQERPSVPEGSELADVVTQSGQTVKAPVGIPAKGAADGMEAMAAPTAKAETPAAEEPAPAPAGEAAKQ